MISLLILIFAVIIELKCSPCQSTTTAYCYNPSKNNTGWQCILWWHGEKPMSTKSMVCAQHLILYFIWRDKTITSCTSNLINSPIKCQNVTTIDLQYETNSWLTLVVSNFSCSRGKILQRPKKLYRHYKYYSYVLITASQCNVRRW